MLQAIAQAAATVATVTNAILGINITNGILGNFTINESGDTSLAPGHRLPAGREEAHPVKTITPDREPRG